MKNSNASPKIYDSGTAAILGYGRVLPLAEPEALKLPEGLVPDVALAHRCPDPLEKGRIPFLIWRRLGRAQKLALMAAQIALKDFQIPTAAAKRAAVCLGTGLGELGETAAFLENVLRLEEREPMPTRFTNAVHNSLASQVAIQFKLAGENHTITHGSMSFELALWQALVLLKTGRAEYILAGGADALNPYAAYAGAELGRWSIIEVPEVIGLPQPRGIFPGEGAAAFLLGVPRAGHWSPSLKAVRVGPMTSRDPQAEAGFLRQAIAAAGLNIGDLDLILTGANSETQLQSIYLPSLSVLCEGAGRDVPYGLYKHRCGEFCAAAALGLALTVEMVQEGRILPELICFGGQTPASLYQVLLYQIGRQGFLSAVVVGR